MAAGDTHSDDGLAYGEEAEDSSEQHGYGLISDLYSRFVAAQAHEQSKNEESKSPPSAGRSLPDPKKRSDDEPEESMLGQIMTYWNTAIPSSQHVQDKAAEFASYLTNTGSSIDQLRLQLGAHLDNLEKQIRTHGNSLFFPTRRFDSFAAPRGENNVKWFVDGCGYFWAVSQALERAEKTIWILDWWLSPELYLRRPPAENEQYRLDRMLKAAAERGIQVNIIVYKEVTQALSLSSSHTKHTLEALHPNIRVIRHPDHLPDAETIRSTFMSENQKITASAAAKAGEDVMKTLYGVSHDVVLFWAHHEKLCIVDEDLAFMGGLDLCYGRWDLNQHPISDVHPTKLNEIAFPGQDYNNARIMDFQDVANWQSNKLDRTTNSRMGWSDVSVCLEGPVIRDLQSHFTQRWNFIVDLKYTADKYPRLSSTDSLARIPRQLSGSSYPRSSCQLLRSCCEWSNGTPVEHSIQNAYISLIEKAEHFIYIENQFFITATGNEQKPIQNKIGLAIVERILKAARAGQKFRIIVVIPAIPAFAGDLRSPDAMSTRAIMQYQYWSINRGGHSIYECIAREGFNPADYIRFYNLRSYDRINSDATLKRAEKQSGVTYEEARKEADDLVGAGYAGQGEGSESLVGQTSKLHKYRTACENIAGDDPKTKENWDTVSECYMLDGEDIRKVPWSEGGNLAEIDAFVSEQLYIHSKVMIVDDKSVICGSANLNDRSMLGSHDSEIAVLIEDGADMDATMNGTECIVSAFATSLRRQLFRKHLGLLRPQDMRKPDLNFQALSTPNAYDFGSVEDKVVEDPLSVSFERLWNERASVNTDAFGRVFHPVPSDNIRNWKQYQEYYERFFPEDTKKSEALSQWKWGHVVAENFKSVSEVKEELSRIRGTLVEMPMNFLNEEQIAKEGLSLNFFTEQVYT